jgi:sortase A
MRDHRYVEDLTTEELERELLLRRREERLTRMRRIGLSDRAGSSVLVPDAETLGPLPATAPASAFGLQRPAAGLQEENAKTPFQVWRERILLGIEVAALVGLIVVVISFLFSVQRLNRDWKEQQNVDALPVPTATPLIRVAILPGGHKPPTTEGGEAEPVGPVPRVAIPTPGPRSPSRLNIPAINVDVPVVEGVDWEQLKMGAGHLIGSANPGERGNCFIAGHNDIYGEIFRDLEELKIGDEIIAYAGQQTYRYIVRATRIVEPDDVSIMYPTSTPVLTLLTCYPYMIDSHRLVVIAELDR